MTNKQILESYDFKLVTRDEFETALDVPAGLHARTAATPGRFVLYDPLDDAEGVEPDARKYLCEACGERHVYRAQELLIRLF